MCFSSELQKQQEPVEREGEERNRGEREGRKEGGARPCMVREGRRELNS